MDKIAKIFSSPGRPPQKENEEEGYLIYKFGRQAGAPIAKVAVKFLEATGNYRINTAQMAQGFSPDLYQRGLTSHLYGGDGRIAGAMRSIYLPSQGGVSGSGSLEPAALQRSGAGFFKYAAWGRQLMMGVRLSGDVVALADCATSECKTAQKVAIGSDSIYVTASMPSIYLRSQGASLMKAGMEGEAFRVLGNSTKIGVGIGVFLAVSGATRLAIETEHYMSTGDANGSAIVYGAIDTVEGSTQAILSAYLLNRASTVASFAQKDAILLAKSVSYTPLVTGALSVAGLLGSGVGLAANVYVVIDAVYNEKLTEEQSRKNFNSGIMGIAGSGLMLVSALMVASPLLPAATIVFAAGTAILIVQTVYDHYDKFGAPGRFSGNHETAVAVNVELLEKYQHTILVLPS